MPSVFRLAAALAMLAALQGSAFAQAAGGQLSGRVTDETAGVLPGVTVELRAGSGAPAAVAVTTMAGEYAFDGVAPGSYQLSFALPSFASETRRDVIVGQGAVRVDVVLHLSLTAEVTVTAKRTFANLEDLERPEENLVGVAQSASQGAITARQLGARPLMRDGEVLEAVPGVIVTAHSGDGKANQYFLRGFNLDHGTDFATTLAGMPVNLPTHAHGHGYTDLNVVIPELVTGMQFSKGPYYADQGDFATAGAANLNYANVLARPIVRIEGGGDRFSRALFAAAPAVGAGHVLAALEVGTNNGPWLHPADARKINGVVRYSQGDAINAFSVTAMGYHMTWNATDAVPQRAITQGLVDRFGSLDPTDGAHSSRYSLAGDWQHGRGTASTRVTAYGIGSDLDLFSNFTFFLEDPVHGDQQEQTDHRFVSGVKVSHRRAARWGGREVLNTFGAQVRNDDIGNVATYFTQARVRLGVRTQHAVRETAGGLYAQNQIEWAPWLRTTAGLRTDAIRMRVDALDPVNSGVVTAGLASPKAGVTFGPWKATEMYVNAGDGYHSNDARGTTITRDLAGLPVDRVTPLVRARGAEAGMRTVAVPHLQSTLSVWRLQLASEIVFNSDAGTGMPSRPSARHGVEWTNYYSPMRWLTVDANLSWSRARFTEFDPVGQYVPEAVGTVMSVGTTITGVHGMFGSARWRYFGPRSLIEDNSVQSQPTSLVNLEGGYQLAKNARVALDVFNLLNSQASDIDYYYATRLPGEAREGVDDLTFHPTLPRTARVNLIVSF
jgi:outer membrane receptor protein involved in Fe transport